ncbi:MAG TPA: hypothetical protein VLK88_13840, partial [Gemmatimonadales bacterium]|nr:hypothetical protein [Gemmatimonadales bacterium]
MVAGHFTAAALPAHSTAHPLQRLQDVGLHRFLVHGRLAALLPLLASAALLGVGAEIATPLTGGGTTGDARTTRTAAWPGTTRTATWTGTALTRSRRGAAAEYGTGTGRTRGATALVGRFGEYSPVFALAFFILQQFGIFFLFGPPPSVVRRA